MVTGTVFRTNSQGISHKRMIPKCLNLVQGMIFRYPSDMVLGLKGQKVKVRVTSGVTY